MDLLDYFEVYLTSLPLILFLLCVYESTAADTFLVVSLRSHVIMMRY